VTITPTPEKKNLGSEPVECGGLPLSWMIFGTPLVTLALVSLYFLIVVGWNWNSRNPDLYPILAVIAGFPLHVLSGFFVWSFIQIGNYFAVPLYCWFLFRRFGRVSLLHLLVATPVFAALAFPGSRQLHSVPEGNEEGSFLIAIFLVWALTTLIVICFWWPLRKTRVTIKTSSVATGSTS